MHLSDQQLRDAYAKLEVGGEMTDHHIKQAKIFISTVFDMLPASGYIDETNAVAFDSFELSGDKVEPTFRKPTWAE